MRCGNHPVTERVARLYVPVVIFTLIVRTYLIRGLTAGGVKD